MAGRLQEIFEGAIRLAPDQRESFLLGACGRDEALHAEITALIAAHERVAEFLVSPTASEEAAAGSEPAYEKPGSRIGAYRLLQLIGEGGFGSVFMAEQERPVHRKVALKIIKLGMDTRRVIARFEAERQALALMDHPNIARVLDAGATDAGRPYFVMELVKGDPITAYCDRNNLSIAQRLELFVQVCHAVQHAHQKGVIHRDLKPGNILVSTQDGRPLAKVIDFGIAKATDHRLTEKTLFTELRALIGTPEYMSPEQAEGSLDIDTRTDVYSLGVLLYELLTGSTPFAAEQLRSAAYAEIQRIIREVEPPKPSTRLSQGVRLSRATQSVAPADAAAPAGADTSQIARHRHTDSRSLSRFVRGDLDWIVMKALEKDRARRYESASDLAADVGRHLAGDPVIAAPPSAAYRLSKFVRRHRGPVLAGAMVVIALAAGLGVATIQYHNASRERDAKGAALAAAEASAKKQSVIEDFLLHRMLGSGNPDFGGTPDLKVREVVDRAAAQAKDIVDPEVRAAVRHELGSIYTALGLFDEARTQLHAALETRESLPAQPRAETAQTLLALARIARIRGEADNADACLDRAQHIAEATDGNRSLLYAQVDAEFAGTLIERGRWREAAERLRAARSTLESLFPAGQEPSFMADVLGGLGRCEEMQGRPEEGAQLLSGAVVILRRHGDGDALADWLTSLAEVYETMGRMDEAQRVADEGMEIRRRVLPAGHPGIAHSLIKLAALRMHAGDMERAEALAREAVAVYTASLGPAHEYTGAARLALAAAIASQERWGDAATEYSHASTIFVALFPPDDWRLANARSQQGACLIEIERYDEAEKLLASAYAALDRTKESPPILSKTALRLAQLYTRWNKPDKAAEWSARAKSQSDPGGG